jgi:hypothetical protein
MKTSFIIIEIMNISLCRPSHPHGLARYENGHKIINIAAVRRLMLPKSCLI